MSGSRLSSGAAIVLAGLALAASPPRAASPVTADEFVFPLASPPTASCHASTLAELPDGMLAAAWFGGTREGASDVGIWFSRKAGGRWSAPVEIADGCQPPLPGPSTALPPRFPCWNPVLFQPAKGPLLLFYKVGPSPSAWWGMLATSADGGRSWGPARRLPEGIVGPIKNKPVALPGGDLLCGSSTEDGGWRVHFERTPDLGGTWTRTEPLDDAASVGAIQPGILVLGDGRLLALGRSRKGRIWEARSADGGRTWTGLRLTDLPNPNSGIDAVTLRDGRHVLVYNPTTTGRTPLGVAVSRDGRTWTQIAILEDAPGEYSYPAVIQGADGAIHVSYTWQRRSIKHVVLDPARF